ncbi:MAG: hypothetical protein ACXW6J_13260 [Candidatus Binatia bacterium]
MGSIQCLVKKRRCKSHVAQITSIEAFFPSVKNMNFSPLRWHSARRTRSISSSTAAPEQVRVSQIKRPIPVRHTHEREAVLEFRTDLPIGVPIVLRRSAGQNLLDPIVQTLQRAQQLTVPVPDSLAQFPLGAGTAIEVKNSTAFHSADVVNWRISPRPLSLFSVDEITLIYDAWT